MPQYKKRHSRPTSLYRNKTIEYNYTFCHHCIGLYPTTLRHFHQLAGNTRLVLHCVLIVAVESDKKSELMSMLCLYGCSERISEIMCNLLKVLCLLNRLPQEVLNSAGMFFLLLQRPTYTLFDISQRCLNANVFYNRYYHYYFVIQPLWEACICTRKLTDYQTPQFVHFYCTVIFDLYILFRYDIKVV